MAQKNRSILSWITTNPPNNQSTKPIASPPRTPTLQHLTISENSRKYSTLLKITKVSKSSTLYGKYSEIRKYMKWMIN